MKTYIILDEPPTKLLWTGEAASYTHATYLASFVEKRITVGERYRVYEIAPTPEMTAEFVADQRRLANEANEALRKRLDAFMSGRGAEADGTPIRN